MDRIKATADSSLHPGAAVVSSFAETDLWAAFETFLVALGGRMILRPELDDLLTQRCYVETAAAKVLGIPAVDDELWDVEIGVSLADLAIAETGTLVVSAGDGKRRMSSLAPPKNIEVIQRSAIVGTLAEAMSKLPKQTNVLITGPSRTADIEGILVRGVHGPGELLVYVYD